MRQVTKEHLDKLTYEVIGAVFEIPREQGVYP